MSARTSNTSLRISSLFCRNSFCSFLAIRRSTNYRFAKMFPSSSLLASHRSVSFLGKVRLSFLAEGFLQINLLREVLVDTPVASIVFVTQTVVIWAFFVKRKLRVIFRSNSKQASEPILNQIPSKVTCQVTSQVTS
jgi:hypothetical protein